MIVRRFCRHSAGDKKAVVRAVSKSVQKRHEMEDNASRHMPVAAENRFDSALLIWELRDCFCVAATNERTSACRVRFQSLKTSRRRVETDSECRTPLSSRSLLTGPPAQPLYLLSGGRATERHRPIWTGEKTRILLGGRAAFSRRSLPVAPDRLCRRLRNEARFGTGSAHALFGPGNPISRKEHRAKANQAPRQHRIRTMGFPPFINK